MSDYLPNLVILGRIFNEHNTFLTFSMNKYENLTPILKAHGCLIL